MLLRLDRLRLVHRLAGLVLLRVARITLLGLLEVLPGCHLLPRREVVLHRRRGCGVVLLHRRGRAGRDRSAMLLVHAGVVILGRRAGRGRTVRIGGGRDNRGRAHRRSSRRRRAG